MNNKSIEETAFFGMAWKTLETVFVNGIQAVIFLVLARLLMPEDFGVVALVGAFIAITNVFVSSGLGTALIQAEDASTEDFSTVLFFSLFIAVLFYCLFFYTAPIISSFYNEPIITNVLRFYALSIVFSAINGVQKSILLRNLEFKMMCIVSLVSVIASGAISISMALLGYGVYAIVFNSLLIGIFSTITFFYSMKWIPVISFLPKRLNQFFSFSYKLLLSNLIEVGYTNIFPLLIGKTYTSAQLGYYNNGKQLPSLAASTINASIASVTFSIYSRYQNNTEKLKAMVRRSIVTSNFIIFPLMAILAASAEPLVTLVLTEKWLPSVIYLQLFCIALGLHHQHNIGFQAISAIGRSDIFLKYQLIKKGIGIFVFLLTIKFGLVFIVLGQVLVAFISIFISLYPYKKYLNYKISEQLKDFYPYLFVTLIMFTASYPIIYLEINILLTILCQLIVAIFFYIFLAFSFKLEGLRYSYNIFKKYVFSKA
tara:strand:- start:2515 stop:3966 length:1452 start_codon:yes stop_codon:yes gene_type:complete